MKTSTIAIMAIAVFLAYSLFSGNDNMARDWRAQAAADAALVSLDGAWVPPPAPDGDVCGSCDGTGWNTTDGTMRKKCQTCGGDGRLTDYDWDEISSVMLASTAPPEPIPAEPVEEAVKPTKAVAASESLGCASGACMTVQRSSVSNSRYYTRTRYHSGPRRVFRRWRR